MTEPPVDPIARLVRLAGSRERIPDAESEPARRLAREAWQRQVRRTARQRLGRQLAVAAGVLVTGALAWRLTSAPPGPVPAGPVARFETRSGEIDASRVGLASGFDVVGNGAVVTTGASGRASLRLTNGPALRIDVASVVRLESPEVVALDSGAVYVDSGATPGFAKVAIATPLGSVHHLGTQFEVRLLPATAATGSVRLRVRVREGDVAVERDGRVSSAAAGEELTVHGDGTVERRAAAVHGPSWEWVQLVAPPLPIEGETLGSFLAWVSRETGRPWRYASAALEEVSQPIVLHGDVTGLTPEEALSVVLPGCGLRHRLVDDLMLIEPSG